MLNPAYEPFFYSDLLLLEPPGLKVGPPFKDSETNNYNCNNTINVLIFKKNVYYAEF